MKPIFFKPIYKNVIWGGDKIAKIFKRDVVGDDIGESWEISAHQNGVSIIQNDEYNGINLCELFNDKTRREEIFGTNCVDMDRFPILVKFLDANKPLSIQVHPNDEYAKKNEHDSGKTECWYIMDCKEEAKIVYGFKDIATPENLIEAVDNIEETINYLNVKKGDFILIPSGTVHAIMDGIVLCEVQQSSDVTYRVYDWNRKDKNGNLRELHKEKALDVIDLKHAKTVHNYNDISENVDICREKVFNIDMVVVNGKQEDISKRESFYAYIVVEGSGELRSNDISVSIAKGDSFLIPATLGEYKFTGSLKMMKVWV